MASAEAEIAKLSATLTQTLAQAESLCEMADRQQETGLSRLFSGVQDSFKSAKCQMLVVALGKDALPRTMEWIFGTEAAKLARWCADKYGIVEVSVRGSEYEVLVGGGEPMRASAPLMLLAQLATAAGTNATERSELMRLSIPQGTSGLQEINFYVVRDLETLHLDSKTMLRLLGRCSSAIISGAATHDLSQTTAAYLAEILPSFEVILPVVESAKPAEENAAVSPRQRWWESPLFAGAVCLPHVELPAGETMPEQAPPAPGIPDMLTSAAHPARQAVHVITHARKLSSAMEAVTPRTDTELKQLSAKQGPLAQRIKEIDEKAKSKDTKGDLDSIKGLLEDELQKIQMEIEDEAARSLMRRGRFVTSTRELVEEISDEDFEDVVGTKTIRRTVTEEFFDRVLGVVSRDLRAQLKKDCERVGSVISELNKDIDEILTKVRGSEAHVDMPLPDENLVWYHLKGEICITARCEVERPKRGVITILTAGRKMMMPFFMTLGLIGFQGVKKSMSQEHWQMALVLIAACTYAYFEANSEQQEKFEKELEKIKDTLTNEIGKIISDVQKEKVSRFNTYFNMLKKQTLKRVDEQVKMFSEARGMVVDREKQNLGNKLKTLDTRIKELQDFNKQMEKLQSVAKDLETNGKKLLAEAAKPAAAGAGSMSSRPSAASSISARAAASATTAVPRASATAALGAEKRVVEAAATTAPAVAVGGASNGETENGDKPLGASAVTAAVAETPRSERPAREPRPERPAREPKEKKEEQPKVSAADRFAALRASFKK
jgi:hypothetical protein